MRTDLTDISAIIDRIDTTWGELEQSYAGLTDEEMLIPGVTGEWSVRDILAHVAVWDAVVLEVLPGILDTGRHPEDDETSDLNTFNARMTEEKRNLPLDQVRWELEQSHQRVLDYLRGATPEEVAANEPFRDRLAADTWDHYPEHTAAIRTWREQRG